MEDLGSRLVLVPCATGTASSAGERHSRVRAAEFLLEREGLRNWISWPSSCTDDGRVVPRGTGSDPDSSSIPGGTAHSRAMTTVR